MTDCDCFLATNQVIRRDPPSLGVGVHVRFRQARPVVFSGNVVSGCPDIGVLMRPETCEAVQQELTCLSIS